MFLFQINHNTTICQHAQIHSSSPLCCMNFLFNNTLVCLQCIGGTDLIFVARHKASREIKVFCGGKETHYISKILEQYSWWKQDHKNSKWPYTDKEVGSKPLASYNNMLLVKTQAMPPQMIDSSVVLTNIYCYEVFSTCPNCYLLLVLSNEFLKTSRHVGL